MLSRVADAVYWMTRYIERAENVARFVQVNLHLLLDSPARGAEQWAPLIDTTGDREIFEEHFGEPTRSNVIQFLTFDPDYPSSVLSCLFRARENARQVRDVISSEMWHQLNMFFLMVRSAAFGERDVVWASNDFFADVRMASHQFAGVMDATMEHGEAWHFGRMGRLLERADKTTRIVDVKYFLLLPEPSAVGTTVDYSQWAALLRSASALEMYRKRHGRIDPVRVAEFLLIDRTFPRAVRHCLGRAEESLHLITGSPARTYDNLAERRLGLLCAEMDYARIEDILQEGLHEFLDGLQTRLNEIGEGIHETFFAMQAAPAGEEPIREGA